MEQVKVSEIEKIIAVVTNYTEGCKKGDTAQMRMAFDKGAVMYGYLNGQLYDGSIDNLYSAVDALGGDDNTKTHIDVLNVEDTVASVRVTLEGWHDLAFTDYHTLLKINGEWKIAAKVFHQF